MHTWYQVLGCNEEASEREREGREIERERELVRERGE